MCDSKQSMVIFSTLVEKFMDKPWDNRYVPKHSIFAIYTFVLYVRKLYTLTLIRFLYSQSMENRPQEVKQMGRHQ